MAFSPSRRLGRWGLLLVLLASPGLSGCGSGTATVTGKVSYKDKTVKGGSVTFISTQGKQSASADIREDGTYTIPKVPAGSVKVCVSTEALNPAKKPKVPKYKPPPGNKAPEGLESGGEDTSKRYVWIPLKYENTDTTTLKYTVKSGSQEYNISLTD